MSESSSSSSQQSENADNDGDENKNNSTLRYSRTSTASSKTPEDIELIRLALHRNPYFTCMDEEQIERFVEVAELQTFRPGQAVILEGCEDDRDEHRDDESIQKQHAPITEDGALADIDELLDFETEESSAKEEDLLDGGRPDFSDEAQNQAIYTDQEENGHIPEQQPQHLESTLDRVPPPSSGSKSYVYVIKTGNADVFYDTMDKASLGPGTLFGEGGFLFGRQHSASIVAGGNLECWVVDHSTFLNHVLLSDNLKNHFSKYASQRDSQGDLYMTMEDFIQSCLGSGGEDQEENSVAQKTGGLSIVNAYQNILRTSARTYTKNNQLYLPDFCLFHLLMARPDPEVDIVFINMDRHKKGTITRADFEEYLCNLPYFDRNSEFVQRHFGQGRTIRAYQFSQFLVDLRKEMGRQDFLHRVRQVEQGPGSERGKGGYLPPEEFIEVLKTTCGWRLPDGIMDRLESLYCKGAIQSAEATAMASVRSGTIKGDTPEKVTNYSSRSVLAGMEYREKRLGTRYFTYVDFLAFQDVLGQLPAICNLIDRTCEIKKGLISPDDFKVANRVLGLGGFLSRMQTDIIFQLFDLDRDGYISAEDAVSVCGLENAYRLEPVPGRNGKFTFAPPPNYPMTKNDSPGIDESKNEATVCAETEDFPQSEHIVSKILNFTTQFLLASVAGGIGIFTVYPLDLVKTRMMNQRIGPDGKRMYLQSFDCLIKTFQYEGFFGLYRGLLPPLLAVGPEKQIKFTVNDMLKSIYSRDRGGSEFKWFMEIVSGGCAGACQLLVTNPLEITKIRMQLQGETRRLVESRGFSPPKPMSFSEVAADLGLSGLYKGAAACLLRDIPFGAIYFPAYAVCKEYLVNQQGSSGSASASNILLAGTLAGIPATFLTTPADVVKTRLQVVPRPGEVSYNGIGDCIKNIYRMEGPTAFFKGSLFRVCRIAPQFGISLLGYEMLSQLLGLKGSLYNPPTNAPVDPSDYRTAFSTTAIGNKTDDIDSLVRNMGFNTPPPSFPTGSDKKR